MRIWDLKQGTSLHVLKGTEELNHLGCSLIGEHPLLVGSELCTSREMAHSGAREGDWYWGSMSLWMLAELRQVEAAEE